MAAAAAMSRSSFRSPAGAVISLCDCLGVAADLNLFTFRWQKKSHSTASPKTLGQLLHAPVCSELIFICRACGHHDEEEKQTGGWCGRMESHRKRSRIPQSKACQQNNAGSHQARTLPLAVNSKESRKTNRLREDGWQIVDFAPIESRQGRQLTASDELKRPQVGNEVWKIGICYLTLLTLLECIRAKDGKGALTHILTKISCKTCRNGSRVGEIKPLEKAAKTALHAAPRLELSQPVDIETLVEVAGIEPETLCVENSVTMQDSDFSPEALTEILTEISGKGRN